MQTKGLWSLLLVLFTSISIANAQQKLVTGKVVGYDKAPLSNVSVLVKGSKVATSTDNAGAFSISVTNNQVLTFSLVGFESKDVRVGSANSIEVRLAPKDNTLDEVVVTAMDIKRNPKELGYSVQKVKGSELAETQRNNFVNGLQGRIAGLTINPTSGLAGASSQIVLRGFNSLSLDNSPLFIIDGVIIDNSSVNENNRNTGLAVKPTSANVSTENRSNDYTNRIADLNPNDIENVTVLKGPEATALYGSQASSGAIVITTKKGGDSDGKIKVSYDNSLRLTTYTRYPEINKINQINQINVTNFDTYFDTLDVTSIQRNMLLLQTTADNNSATLNNILRNIGLNNSSAPVSVATQLNSYYSNIQTRAALNNTGRFLENDLILLKADLKQLKNITNTNKILITIIENQIAPLR